MTRPITPHPPGWHKPQQDVLVIIDDLVARVEKLERMILQPQDPPTWFYTGTLATVGPKHRWEAEVEYRVSSVRATLGTAPDSGDVVIDVLKNGSSIFDSNKLTFHNSEFSVLATVLDPRIVAGEYYQAEILSAPGSEADLEVLVRLDRP